MCLEPVGPAIWISITGRSPALLHGSDRWSGDLTGTPDRLLAAGVRAR
jgi:hypothetical protein